MVPVLFFCPRPVGLKIVAVRGRGALSGESGRLDADNGKAAGQQSARQRPLMSPDAAVIGGGLIARRAAPPVPKATPHRRAC